VKPHVDIPRIKAIHDLVHAPLVLHGASGVDAETISQAIQNGIRLINVDTELELLSSIRSENILQATLRKSIRDGS
jgi:fructose/tagatose bisphosphate aldolase